MTDVLVESLHRISDNQLRAIAEKEKQLAEQQKRREDDLQQ